MIFGLRVAIALAVVATGVVAGVNALSAVLAETNPELALRLVPHNVVALETKAASSIVDVNDRAARGTAVALATSALARDAGAASAAVTLAIVRGVEGEKARSTALMTAVERLTRRDLRANVWQVEDSVARADIAGALRHFDFALRTSEAAPDLMYPTLNAAINDRRLVGPIAKLLSTRPPWAVPFLAQLGSAAPDPVNAAEFYRTVKRAGINPPAIGWTAAVDRLASRGDTQRARDTYAALRGIAPTTLVNDPNFQGVADSPSVFDWFASSGDGLQVQIGGGAPQLSFNAPADYDGNIARQMLVLAPGRYLLRSAATLGEGNGATPTWTIACVSGNSLAAVPLTSGQEASASFSVPKACPAQWIALALVNADADRGTSAQISSVNIRAIP